MKKLKLNQAELGVFCIYNKDESLFFIIFIIFSSGKFYKESSLTE